MPTYDFNCIECGRVFEANAPMGADLIACPCGGAAKRQFTPTANFLIPQRFRLDRNWNNAPDSKGEPWSRNNTVHTPKRTTFKEEFDKNWKAAGGA